MKRVCGELLWRTMEDDITTVTFTNVTPPPPIFVNKSDICECGGVRLVNVKIMHTKILLLSL